MKLGQKLKQLVGAVAPTIGTAIGGPWGAMAGKFVQEKLGVDTEEAALLVLENDPDAMLKMKQADQEFAKHLADNGVELENIAAQDRNSARDLAKARGMVPQMVLSGLYTVGYFFVFWLCLTGRADIIVGQETLVAGLIGVLTAAQIQIMNFWFGSSSGSSRKTDMMSAKT